MKMIFSKRLLSNAARGDTFSPKLFDDSLQVFLLLASVLLNITSWVLLSFFIGFGTETVVFHYNAYFGVDLTSRSWQLIVFPTVGLVFLFANTLLAFDFFRKRQEAAALSVSVISFFLQIAVLVVVGALILVNT